MFYIRFGNIVNDMMFVLGLLGLLNGNLILTNNFHIKKFHSSVIGLIFLFPLLLCVFGYTYWHDLMPPFICIAISIIYLFCTTSSLHPNLYKFWLIAMIPVLFRFSIYCYSNIWNSFVEYSLTIPILREFIIYLPFFIFDLILPVTVAFFAAFLVPVARTKTSAFLFAIPSFLFLFHYSLLDWGMPYVFALQYPNGPYGHPSLVPFALSIIGNLFILTLVALVAWVGSNVNHKLFNTKNNPVETSEK